MSRVVPIIVQLLQNVADKVVDLTDPGVNPLVDLLDAEVAGTKAWFARHVARNKLEYDAAFETPVVEKAEFIAVRSSCMAASTSAMASMLLSTGLGEFVSKEQGGTDA